MVISLFFEYSKAVRLQKPTMTDLVDNGYAVTVVNETNNIPNLTLPTEARDAQVEHDALV